MSTTDNGSSAPEQEEDKTSENEGQKTDTSKKDELQDKVSEYKNRMEHHKKKDKEKGEKIKELESKLENVKDKMEDADKDYSSEIDDVNRIVEVTKATKGLEDDDIEQLQDVADAKGVSLSEARDTDLFQGYLDNKKQKVDKENKTPEPDTRQPSEDKSDFSSWNREDYKKASNDEKLKFNKWRENLSPGEAPF